MGLLSKEKKTVKYIQVSDDLVETFVDGCSSQLESSIQEYGISNEKKIKEKVLIFCLGIGCLAIHNCKFSADDRIVLEATFLMNANSQRLEMGNIVERTRDEAQKLSEAAVSGKGASEFVRLAVYFLDQFNSKDGALLLLVTGVVSASMKSSIDFLNSLSTKFEMTT